MKKTTHASLFMWRNWGFVRLRHCPHVMMICTLKKMASHKSETSFSTISVFYSFVTTSVLETKGMDIKTLNQIFFLVTKEVYCPGGCLKSRNNKYKHHVHRFRREKIIACFSQIWAVDVYLFNALISKRTADGYIAVLPRRHWTLRHNFVSFRIIPST